MAEDLQNPDNVQAAAGNPVADGEEYEYEYIELAEGEELPEDAEYEYVEVSDDEMPSMIPPTYRRLTFPNRKYRRRNRLYLLHRKPLPSRRLPRLFSLLMRLCRRLPFHNRYRFRRWRKQI